MKLPRLCPPVLTLLALVGTLLAQQPLLAQDATQPATAQTHAQPATAHDTARPAYFIDGYHGGIYGHIPPWQTKFMVEKLREFPGWKINLELEPESWDSIALEYPDDYAAFKTCLADQSANGRVEYVNPAYGQSYLYNISGESIIRQFYYGMRKLRQHFPGLVFSTYSSEEPCFTSALPQILKSYGFKYASLKNPNTCWGGYTRAHGGELVNWIGPDGTALLTVPRYAVEALKPHSTWETIAENNSLAYVLTAFRAGIHEPVGMCLQDAGWAFGPWIKPGEAYKPGANDIDDVKDSYHPTVYETWRGYIERHTPRKTSDDWHFSQEDVLTSLVWGGQVLQQVARNVRRAENKLVAAEKLAAMAAVYKGVPWPGASFDEAWRTLLLSQHHDCWIVPYNVVRGTTHTWAEWVERWTGNTIGRSDSIAAASMASLAPYANAITVFNTTAAERRECVELTLPEGWRDAVVTNLLGNPVTTQRTADGKLLFNAIVSPLGTEHYGLHRAAATSGSQSAATSTSQVAATSTSQSAATSTSQSAGTSTSQVAATGASQGAATSTSQVAATRTSQGARASAQDGNIDIETDRYSIALDAQKGGVITRLLTKGPDAKNFIDKKAAYYFNELRGNFYNDGGFHSSTETPASVHILENGPLRVRVQIDGHIAGTPFTQMLTVTQGEPRIDIHLEIHWTESHRIGQSPESIKGFPLKKEFYNDSFKLQALFPVALKGQKIYKNAPFDVLKSSLGNTFFDSWDSIKNVVVHTWVDVTDAAGKYGLAVFTDETTSYAHGSNYPLALTIGYSGPGLFGRDYTITAPTIMDYAILPHTGRWDQAGIWTAATRWNEPLLVQNGARDAGGSFLSLTNPGWEVSSMTISGQNLLVRLFNAEGEDSIQHIRPDFRVKTANLVALDGHIIQRLDFHDGSFDTKYVEITAPRFGIRTIQFKDVIK
ncbi:MAG TPA: glycoside hydrolase family 38 C-terminal domain-containing protein [Puia sp.]|nr:glycoside hydrolase family 38 C-terminal domain-containing protein [Puia sp.]